MSDTLAVLDTTTTNTFNDEWLSALQGACPSPRFAVVCLQKVEPPCGVVTAILARP